MKSTLTLLFFTLFYVFSFAQSDDGYWDTNFKTEKYIVLGSGQRTWHKVVLPVGTTQLIYRVSFLDANKNIESAATLLNLIPSSYTKVAANVLQALDNFGGDNKGQYIVFKKREDADNFINTNVCSNYCYKSSTDIPGEKNYFILDKNQCLMAGTDILYFAFKNCNYFDSEKIFLEVLPWVDNLASRGWTKEIKEHFLQNCLKENDFAYPDETCNCLLNNLITKYKLQDFQNLTETEMNSQIEQLVFDCFDETGETDIWLNEQRHLADSFASIGNYTIAIEGLLEIIDHDYAEAIDYNNIGYYYIMAKQYLTAIKYLKEGETIDETDLLIKGNLAHAYLLNNDFDLAKEIYLKYKNQNIDAETSWIQMVKEDFTNFRKHNIVSKDFETILLLLK